MYTHAYLKHVVILDVEHSDLYPLTPKYPKDLMKEQSLLFFSRCFQGSFFKCIDKIWAIIIFFEGQMFSWNIFNFGQ